MPQGAPAAAPARAPAPAAAAPAAKPATIKPGSEAGRTPFPSAGLGAPLVSAPASPPRIASPPPPSMATDARRAESYYETKGTAFGALIEAIALAQPPRLDPDACREEIPNRRNDT